MIIGLIVIYFLIGIFLNYVYGDYPPVKGFKSIPYMLISPLWALVGLILVLVAVGLHGLGVVMTYLKRKE